METYKITYSNKEIEFELYRKPVKNINLNVKPDLSIMVSANDDVPIDYIMKFVKGKGTWIIKQLNYFNKTLPEHYGKKEYVNGESFKYLGKQYRLKVYESKDEYVKYYRGFIEMYIKDKSDLKRKEILILNWYKERRKIVFQEILKKVFPVIEKYGIKKPKIDIRTMKVRWGSCIKEKQTILLNSELIKAPKYCIQYVILHELIHFKYDNHNNDFKELLTALMPDWKKRKAVLDEEVVRDL